MVGFPPLSAGLLISSQLTPQPSSLSQHCSPRLSVPVISLSKTDIILLREDPLPQWGCGCFSLSLCFIFRSFVIFCYCLFSKELFQCLITFQWLKERVCQRKRYFTPKVLICSLGTQPSYPVYKIQEYIACVYLPLAWCLFNSFPPEFPIWQQKANSSFIRGIKGDFLHFLRRPSEPQSTDSTPDTYLPLRLYWLGWEISIWQML